MKKNKLLNRISLWWRSLRFFRHYIIADCNDNSITFSRKLYKHIELSAHCDERAQVYVFHIPAWNTYGFAVNPDLGDKDTQLNDIQYNEKYKTIGFESLCPSVNKILHDYGLPFGLKMKLTVTIHHFADNKVFYNIERPR